MLDMWMWLMVPRLEVGFKWLLRSAFRRQKGKKFGEECGEGQSRPMIGNLNRYFVSGLKMWGVWNGAELVMDVETLFGFERIFEKTRCISRLFTATDRNIILTSRFREVLSPQ